MEIKKWYQIILLFCKFYFSLEFLTFEVVNNADGEWSFPEGLHVTLVCIYRPYRGIHRFVFNSTIVSACTGTFCTTLDNDQGGFSFKQDTDSGIFTWTINTVYLKYNNTSFICIDVEDEIKHIATVTVKGYSKVNYQNNEKIVVVVAVVVGVVSSVLVCISVANFFCIHKRRSTEDVQDADYSKVTDEKEEEFANIIVIKQTTLK